MRRLLTIIILVLSVISTKAQSGMPFFVNFSEEDYDAQSNNFDVVCDKNGTVFFANFEGLLYYDQSEWRIIRTSNVQRITVLYRDSSGRIVVGGNNYLGYISASANGALQLKPIIGKGDFGEIKYIGEEGKTIWFNTVSGKSYLLKGNKPIQDTKLRDSNSSMQEYHGAIVNQTLTTDEGITLLATNNGLLGIDTNGQEIFAINEASGLCNNNVNKIAVDGYGGIWGATDSGIFYVDIQSAFRRYTQSEGLQGTTLSVTRYKGTVYAGTQQGLYKYAGQNRFSQVSKVGQMCYDLFNAPDGSLMAATGEGIFRITPSDVKQLSTASSMAVLMTHDGRIYSGEMDGIYQIMLNGNRKLASSRTSRAENVNALYAGTNGEIWAVTINGDYYILKPGASEFQKATEKEVLSDRHMGIYKKYFPNMTYVDYRGIVWTTLPDGKGLRGLLNGKPVMGFDQNLYPLHDLTVRTVFRDSQSVLLGGKFGLVHWNLNDKSSPKYSADSELKIFIRSVVQNQTNVLWGGYDESKLAPKETLSDIDIDENTNHLLITYSATHATALGVVEYSYRVDGDEWSEWSVKPYTEFNNPRYGRHKFEVRARDNMGRMIAPTSVTYSIPYPFYLTWWFILICIIAIGGLSYWLNRIRTQHEMMKLERLVDERTAELRKAQEQLIQQEKVATVGKLTSGLIDRILNPMNYINNFSHLTLGLLKDLQADIDDEKDNISEDSYDDMLDIVDMARGNLEKIESHGTNTSRIIKAMEQVLQERKHIFKPYNMVALCRQALNLLNDTFSEEVKALGIVTQLQNAEDDIEVDMNSELILRGFTGMLANSLYSIQKKHKQKSFEPMITINVARLDDGKVSVVLRDNGLGIEQSVIDKIYDPFFTTKTTAEAAGVGLYLTREIVLDHGGTIDVESEKGAYCQFNIVLPIKH